MHAIGKIRNMIVLRIAPSIFENMAIAMYAPATITDVALAIIIVCSNVCGEGQNPAAGFCTFTALLGVFFCVFTESLAES